MSVCWGGGVGTYSHCAGQQHCPPCPPGCQLGSRAGREGSPAVKLSPHTAQERVSLAVSGSPGQDTRVTSVVWRKVCNPACPWTPALTGACLCYQGCNAKLEPLRKEVDGLAGRCPGRHGGRVCADSSGCSALPTRPHQCPAMALMALTDPYHLHIPTWTVPSSCLRQAQSSAWHLGQTLCVPGSSWAVTALKGHIPVEQWCPQPCGSLPLGWDGMLSTEAKEGIPGRWPCREGWRHPQRRGHRARLWALHAAGSRQQVGRAGSRLQVQQPCSSCWERPVQPPRAWRLPVPQGSAEGPGRCAWRWPGVQGETGTPQLLPPPHQPWL